MEHRASLKRCAWGDVRIDICCKLPSVTEMLQTTFRDRNVANYSEIHCKSDSEFRCKSVSEFHIFSFALQVGN
jgi:hypothetical protein